MSRMRSIELAGEACRSTRAPFLFEDQRLQMLWDHWRASLRPSHLPRREDVDFEPLRAVLPILWIYRLDDSGRDFYCEFAGTEIAAAWKRPGLIGLPISQLFGPAVHAALRTRWLELIDRPAVMHGSVRYSALWADANSPRRPERLCLPLTGADGRPYGVVGATSYAGGDETDDALLRMLPPRIVAVEDLVRE